MSFNLQFNLITIFFLNNYKTKIKDIKQKDGRIRPTRRSPRLVELMEGGGSEILVEYDVKKCMCEFHCCSIVNQN